MKGFPGFLLVTVLALGCGEPPAGREASNAVPAPEWVTVYHPRAAWNGYTLTLHRARIPVLLDMNGRTVHSWPEARVKSRDLTHINSVQELPENPWHAAGDPRFRPGNLLLSARSLNTIFIVDRTSGAVVWSFSQGLDRQHEALMNGPGLPGPGRIQIFNNRQQSFWSDHQSELLEIDPRDGPVVWRYRAPGFFSPTGGTQQALPNGNLLVTSTRGKRIFEITREGRIAWEWAPPRYEPVRALRVARDACPQLARLAFPTPSAVVPPPGYGHVDGDAYRFARRGARTAAVVEGTKRYVLKGENDCRNLTLPMTARVRIGYGVDRKKLRAAGRAGNPPEFLLLLRPEGKDEEVELLRDPVGLDGPAWRRRTIPLDAWALQSVRLCVRIEGGAPGAGGSQRFAWWEQPLINTARGMERADEADGAATTGARTT